jgi:hypothetical protein
MSAEEETKTAPVEEKTTGDKRKADDAEQVVAADEEGSKK